MVDASANTVSSNIQLIQNNINEAELKYQREPGSVQLLAVSKTRPIEDIYAAVITKQSHFGENYLQDALPKISAAEANKMQLNWHFIGPIQSNKTQAVATHFSWVHSIDRLKIARRLSEQRPAELDDINICLQINTSAEASKSGIQPEEVLKLAKEISLLPNIHLRGLMTIPAKCIGLNEQRRPFQLLRELRDDCIKQGIEMDTLSMGMTNDMEAAIAEGSTMVRIGTAIFGARN